MAVKKKSKKGQIWISTVLYIALGIVAITLILGAGLPMINKMRERNAVIEAKVVMHAVSDAITTVVTEGPGSKRVLDPVIIKGGRLLFDVDNEKVRWEMKTSAFMMEPCPDSDKDSECDNTDLIQREGDLKIYLLETIVVDEYLIVIELNYPQTSIDLAYTPNNEVRGSLIGSHLVAISNDCKLLEKITVGIYIN